MMVDILALLVREQTLILSENTLRTKGEKGINSNLLILPRRKAPQLAAIGIAEALSVYHACLCYALRGVADDD